MHPFVQAVVRFSNDHALFAFPAEGMDDGSGGEAVLVALSGGPDSCALLLALQEAFAAGALTGTLAGAAHFHHGLRGQDADEDAAFAAALCARLSVRCVIGLGAVGAVRRSHADVGSRSSPNVAARRARYAFLQRAAADLDARIIATGHTRDDQAETVLLRVLRGTGVDGLAGIPAQRVLPAPAGASSDGALLRVIRPILNLSRADVEAFCRDRNVVPRCDPSNTDTRYGRARARALLPRLARETENPRLCDALCRLSTAAAHDADLLGRLTNDLWALAARTVPRRVRLDVGRLMAAHPALRRRVLLRALRWAANSNRAVAVPEDEGSSETGFVTFGDVAPTNGDEGAAATTANVDVLEALLTRTPEGKRRVGATHLGSAVEAWREAAGAAEHGWLVVGGSGRGVSGLPTKDHLNGPPATTLPDYRVTLPIPGRVWIGPPAALWLTTTIPAAVWPHSTAATPPPRDLPIRRALIVTMALPLPDSSAPTTVYDRMNDGSTDSQQASVAAMPPLLEVRPARRGERIAPLGMAGRTRLVRDVMADAGWAASGRDVAPVVARVDTGEVVWIIGLAQAESTRVMMPVDAGIDEKGRPLCLVRLRAEPGC